MFEVLKGNNGRTIYVGKVTAKNDNQLRLEGTEWDQNIQQMVGKKLDCNISPDTVKTAEKVRVGQFIMVMMMPSKNNPSVGTAEEIAVPGNILSLVNSKGNPKKVVLGVAKNPRRSKSGKAMVVGMTDVTEYGVKVGKESSYTGSDGNVYESRWTTFIACNSEKYGKKLADRMEKAVKKQDLLLVVFHEAEGEYNGSPEVSMFVDRFCVIYRNKDVQAESAPQQQTQQAEPISQQQARKQNLASQQQTPASPVTQSQTLQAQSETKGFGDGFMDVMDVPGLLDELPFK